MEAERAGGGEAKEGEDPNTPKPSLFPLFPLPNNSSPSDPPFSSGSQWLANTSFTFDVSSLVGSGAGDALREEPANLDSDDEVPAAARPPPPSYDLVPSSPSVSSSEDERRSKRKARRKKRKREREGVGDGAPRKSAVRAWSGSVMKPVKDYYFDADGDKDNLAFGSLYRMDIARYKTQNYGESTGTNFWALYHLRTSALDMNNEGDNDALGNKQKSQGRYYSAKFTMIERNKAFRNIKFVNKISSVMPEDFLPLPESHSSAENGPSVNNELEESWEDEMIRKTREFNRISRDRPNDEKVWLSFAEFQDKVASTLTKKAARLQMLEKKVSILEKAVEFNPNSEELLLCLLKTYLNRDTIDIAMEKWEKILIQHSDSCKLWKEFLLFCQGDFSQFKVSKIRKSYAHAIQALSAALDKQRRQGSASLQSVDSSLVQLELGLVDIFLSYCRFEWQVGYQELATGLFQAEMEYSLFCPSLVLSSNSKQRLFEHFWKSNAARVGEDGALGWSSWLEKDEQTRQNITGEDTTAQNEVGGWTGWFELSSKHNTTSRESEISADPDVDDTAAEMNLDFEENLDSEEIPPADDVETLLKKLGIDIDAEPNNEVKDSETWNRWSKEELIRDDEQWMPVHENPDETGMVASPHSNDNSGKDDGEQLSRVILFEDVCDYLFSLSSKEAHLSLVCQFIDFYGGKISQWTNTNKSTWIERILSLEAVPHAILDDLRIIFQLVNKQQDSSHFMLETLLSHTSTSSKANMMKFLRNAILLCLDVLPRNHMLQEALLFAEEFFRSNMNSSTRSINPSRALAKSLLKKDRQDLLLCGVYAQTEAKYGNMDMARKIFDMALLSMDALPMDLQENIPLLYFWYADMEIAMSTSNSNSELSSQRAIHILSCLGGNVKYTPFSSQPSPVQILRARQGFKELIKSLRPVCARGSIGEQSLALICAASLFEILTNDWFTGIQVIEEAFSMVLPERRSQSLQLECLWVYYIKMLERHKQLNFSRVWKTTTQGYQTYPHNPKSFRAILQVSYLYNVSSKVRRIFDECCQRYPSVIMCLFALAFEIGAAGSYHRIHSLFERALSNEKLQKSVLLWRCYLEYEANIAHNLSAARRIFFRAIHACPWSKRLWLDGFQKLSNVLSAKELSDLQEVMRDKELNLRTDIYEILLQDEMPS
ncbi:nuclear exosome regulator NRDE2-like isoform X1 [Zingiber officinale]|uniref:nuclear exosome regulator NRDE2-like isoform X1 n=1 Tax=Zingiber officinale TaxID=94328 RepID=UPI001C4AA776|nr:nuclear exosome regulator NRDE2-like isoform X1 [Zingiber officinale]